MTEGQWIYTLFAGESSTFARRVRRFKMTNVGERCVFCKTSAASVYVERVLISYKMCEDCWLHLYRLCKAVPLTPQEAAGVFDDD